MLPKILIVAGVSLASLLALATQPGQATANRGRIQNIQLTILAGDRIVEPNVALAPNLPVRLTIINTTHEFHTFTIPALHISRLVLPAIGHSARKNTFTLTLDTWGPVPWRCIICPSGEHGGKRAMGGTFYVIIDRSTIT
jgi:hypothetical protein